jgi:two-component system, OmpR family, phosphate regulon sensor histidine kinase PhoR
MKKIRLSIASILLGLSVVSLLIIQAFQMLQLYERKSTQFEQNQSTCIDKIAFRHEKAEDIRRYMQIVNRDFSGQYKDILKEEFQNLLSAKESISIRDTNILINGKIEEYLVIKGKAYDSISGVVAEQKVLARDVREIRDLFQPQSGIQNGDSTRISIQLNQKVLQQIFKKAKFVNELMMQAFRDNIYQTPERRIDALFLDSIIKRELSKEDLPDQYQFAITDEAGNWVNFSVFPSTYNKKIDTKICAKTTLFPNNTLDEALYLYIYFPTKQAFILKEMKASFIISILLIVIVIIALIFMYKTIREQRKLSEIKSDFISNMTHEFKTPISTISLACQALSDKDMVKEETQHQIQPFVKMIHQENKRLEILVESILHSAVLDKGEIRHNNVMLDLKEITQNLVQNAQFRIQGKEGVIQFKTIGESFEVFGDKMHVTNLVANLIDNAIKYSLEKIEVDIILENANKTITLTVIDKGLGIKKEHLPKIFDKLYRIPTGNVHNVKGFGLGLSYVKSICEQYGWNITVKSQYGEGSQFTVNFKNKKIWKEI